eukprot:g4919.t1
MAGGGGSSASSNHEQTRNLFEQENDAQISALHGQIGQLKELTLNINSEVNEQNKFLNNMGKEFDDTEGLLSGTMGKLKNMVAAGGSSHMCTLIAFVVFVFLALYFVIGKS